MIWGSPGWPDTSSRAKSPARRPAVAGRLAFTSKRFVVASPAGATAVTVAVIGSDCPSTTARTFAPGRSAAATACSTVARTSSPPWPSISTSVMPGFTTSPRFTGRAATRPANGARRAAWESASFAAVTWACDPAMRAVISSSSRGVAAPFFRSASVRDRSALTALRPASAAASAERRAASSRRTTTAPAATD